MFKNYIVSTTLHLLNKCRLLLYGIICSTLGILGLSTNRLAEWAIGLYFCNQKGKEEREMQR